MNKSRRKELTDLQTKFQELLGELETIKDDESQSFEDMPENLQGSERGETTQETVDLLETLYDELESLFEYNFDEIIER